MSLLSYVELVKLVEDGVIVGVEPEQINPASIDVRLGPIIRYELCRDTGRTSISLKDRECVPMGEWDLESKPYIMATGEFILASTIETFNLPNDIVAQFELKSSTARTGLEHLKAGFCDPGWHGSVLTMEFKNMLRFNRITLHHGVRIGQMKFYRVTPVPADRSYAVVGRYNNDKQAQGVKK